MSALTPLGQRTRAGFIKKYGVKGGSTKFREAMDKGLIDRSKMENLGLVDDKDRAAEGDLGTLDPQEGGSGPPAPKGGVGRGAPGTFQKRPG